MENPHYIGKLENLEGIGNVKGEVPERKIIPHGCTDNLPSLVLKEYIMQEPGKDFPLMHELVDIDMLLPIILVI